MKGRRRKKRRRKENERETERKEMMRTERGKEIKRPRKIIASFFGATAYIWALAYLHETFRFTSVYYILDIL
jgi:hypothetical protein